MGPWAYAVRGLIGRPGQAFAVLVGVAVGVAMAVAAWTVAGTARAGYRDLFDGLAGPAALEVFAPGDGPFDPALTAPITHVPGVRAVLPQIQFAASLRTRTGPVPVAVVGRSPADREPILGDGEARIGTRLAEANGIALGDRVWLWGPTGPAELTVVGRLPALTADPAGGLIVEVSLATAQRLAGFGASVNRVRLVLNDGADARTVRAEVGRCLPPGLAQRAPSAAADVASGLRSAAEQGLVGLTAIAVAGAGLVVLNIVQLTLHRRRHELAILRSLGASVRQVEGVFLRQALLLGLAGALTGTCGGLILAVVVVPGTEAVTGVPLTAPAIGWDAPALGFTTGVGLALAAVWLPTRSLCRHRPLDLFRPVVAAGVVLRGSRFRIGGLGAAGLLMSAVLGWVPPATGQSLFPYALVILLAATAAVVTPALPRLLAWFETPARFAFGTPGLLSVRLLGCRPDRTARTAGVVFVAVTVSIGFGHTVRNTLADVRDWCRRAIPADYLVRGSMPDPGFLLVAPLPESLGDTIGRIDGVEAVDRIAFIPTHVGEQPVLVLARSFPVNRPLPLDLRGPDPEPIRRGLAAGETVLGDGLARELGVGPGDAVVFDTPGGPHRIRVAGIATEYAAGGHSLYLDWDTAGELFGPRGVHVFLITTRPGREATASAGLRRFCAERGLLLQSNADLRRGVDDLIRATTAALWALLVLQFGVAGLGIANTVAVIAYEQRRDISILRAVGMGPRAARRLACVQGLVLVLTGLPLGIAFGAASAVLLSRALDELWGYGVPFRIEWGLIAVVAGMTTLLGLTVPVIRDLWDRFRGLHRGD